MIYNIAVLYLQVDLLCKKYMKREKVLFFSNIRHFTDYVELGSSEMIKKTNKYSLIIQDYCLKKNPDVLEINRIYFGNEFCDNLIPSINDIQTVYNYCIEKALGFSLVFPYVTQEKMRKVEDILDYILEHQINMEIVCNDWGCVYLVHERCPKQKIILGRLLDKMYKDVRIGENSYHSIFEENSLRYLKNTNAFCESNIEFLKKYNINRVELDCPPQGLALQGAKGINDINVSLYTNFGFIATGRMCMMRFLDAEGVPKFSLENECGRKCQVWNQKMKKNKNIYACNDSNFMTDTMELYRKGNTIFYLTDNVEKILENNIQIDREIYQLCIPM